MTDTTRTPPTLADLRARRVEILALADKYGAYNVRVFGSVARGEATPDSDVDLLIGFPSNKSVFELVGLWLDMQEMLDCEVSLITDGIQDERFMRSVLRDAVSL
jgi:uncharacterized protein